MSDLTTKELQVLMPLIDAGVRATGLQLFQTENGGALLQSALEKLQKMADRTAETSEASCSRSSP